MPLTTDFRSGPEVLAWSALGIRCGGSAAPLRGNQTLRVSCGMRHTARSNGSHVSNGTAIGSEQSVVRQRNQSACRGRPMRRHAVPSRSPPTRLSKDIDV